MKYILMLSVLFASCLFAQDDSAAAEVTMGKMPTDGVVVPQARCSDRLAAPAGEPAQSTCDQPKPRCEQPKVKCERPKPPKCEQPKPKCERPKPPKCEEPKPKCERPKPPKCPEPKCEKKPKCEKTSRCDECTINPNQSKCKSAARKVVEGS